MPHTKFSIVSSQGGAPSIRNWPRLVHPFSSSRSSRSVTAGPLVLPLHLAGVEQAHERRLLGRQQSGQLGGGAGPRLGTVVLPLLRHRLEHFHERGNLGLTPGEAECAGRHDRSSEIWTPNVSRSGRR